MSELYGLWGGRPPGGWCTFKLTSIVTRLGFGFVGTKEEAEAGALAFAKEREERDLKYGPSKEKPCEYTPAPFDHEREPKGVLCLPSEAQAKALQILERWVSVHEENEFFFETRDSTLTVLHDRGWYMKILDANGNEPNFLERARSRITKAGRESLEMWRMKR